MLRDNLVGLIEPMQISAGADPLALSIQKQASDDRPSCLENPRPERAESSLTENVTSPFQAEPTHNRVREQEVGIICDRTGHSLSSILLEQSRRRSRVRVSSAPPKHWVLEGYEVQKGGVPTSAIPGIGLKREAVRISRCKPTAGKTPLKNARSARRIPGRPPQTLSKCGFREVKRWAVSRLPNFLSLSFLPRFCTTQR